MEAVPIDRGGDRLPISRVADRSAALEIAEPALQGRAYFRGVLQHQHPLGLRRNSLDQRTESEGVRAATHLH